jgi:hypothetical protein
MPHVHQVQPEVPLVNHIGFPPVNLACQNLHVILGNNGIQNMDLNLPPQQLPFDLKGPHQLDENDFMELNDLLNPVIQNQEPPQAVMALAAPVPPLDVDMLPIADDQSDMTVTISSAVPSSDESGGSVNGHQQNIQVGLSLIPEIIVDPVASLSATYTSDANPVSPQLHAIHNDIFLSKEGIAAWSTHFKPDGSIINTVNIPAQWADFFTAKLLTPEDFD